MKKILPLSIILFILTTSNPAILNFKFKEKATNIPAPMENVDIILKNCNNTQSILTFISDPSISPYQSMNYLYTSGNSFIKQVDSKDLLSRKSDLSQGVSISIFPDSIRSDVAHKPLGINLDYFMDDDNFLKPARRTADALKEMGVKYLRYPGGNKSDFYFFSKPPYEKSEPTLARTGRGAVHGRNAALNEDCTDFKNDVLDFDEFMAVCREVGAEPVIVVAADEYDRDYPAGSTWSTRDELINHAVEWVRYANLKKKYGVTYWMIANEPWVFQSNPCIYANDVVAFSKAMKAVDSTIKIIPSAILDDWWETIFRICSDHIDDICISNYPINTTDTLFSYTGDDNPVRIAVEAIDKYGTPEQKSKMGVIVAEFGPFNFASDDRESLVNNQRNNMINFEIMAYQLLEPRVRFSCFWNTRWIQTRRRSGNISAFDALDHNGYFNANGYGLMIWGKYLGDNMVNAVSSAFDTLSVFSSFSPSENKLLVYLLNKTNHAMAAEITIYDYNITGVHQVWELKGEDLDDQKPVWSKVTGLNDPRVLLIPGATIRVIEYMVDK